MKLNKFLLLIVLSFALFSCKEESEDKRPNIVFIMSDDHAFQAISAYDDKLIQTPNIDKIAKRGALMQQAYVTNSICSPSRAVILTGKYSHVNGMKDNGTYFDTSQETFPKILRRAGYKTAIIGKWHLFSNPESFDYWDILPDQGHYYNPEFIHNGRDTTYVGYVTDVITEQSIKWIEKNKDQPFCLMLQHKAPHRNWMPPLKYLDLYKDKSFELPSNFYSNYNLQLGLQRQQISIVDSCLDLRYDSKLVCDDYFVHPVNWWASSEWNKEIDRLTMEEREIWDSHYGAIVEEYEKLPKTGNALIEWQYQRYLQDYLRCVKSVDDNVGTVLKYLEDNDLLDNTIVIYTSDQGFFLGEHGIYDKRFMYEESFRTPMMIMYPNQIKSGQTINQFTMNLDIAPTLLDFAQLPIPKEMQGLSMKKILTKGEDEDWRDAMYYHYYEKSFGGTPHYGIRKGNYKLMHFYGDIDSWELYNLTTDPKENNNLYEEFKDDKLVSSLKMELLKLQKEYKDVDVQKFNN
ncbi:MAG: sulfatase [Bacteroidales bacterium]